MAGWTAPKVAKAIAGHLGPGYTARGSVCARLDLLRRQIEVRRRADSVFDKERRTRVDTPAAELICEVTYPPEHLNGPCESLGVTFQLRAVHTAGEVAYPWPARPADDLCEPLWHDAATVAPRALTAVADAAALVRLLLSRGPLPPGRR
ncbi:hypothetical protein ABT369_31645 [Dactylosporangium sp. NPDC000244]|uniref:hypothetical protein n=1 Tax=Dactylosporangium sp. NPDC000244 TaxID=3154365 RepID=UPI00333305A0